MKIFCVCFFKKCKTNRIPCTIVHCAISVCTIKLPNEFNKIALLQFGVHMQVAKYRKYVHRSSINGMHRLQHFARAHMYYLCLLTAFFAPNWLQYQETSIENMFDDFIFSLKSQFDKSASRFVNQFM